VRNTITGSLTTDNGPSHFPLLFAQRAIRHHALKLCVAPLPLNILFNNFIELGGHIIRSLRGCEIPSYPHILKNLIGFKV
jgi:hypothetical protein